MKSINGLNKRSIICGVITMTCYCGGSALAYILGKHEGEHTGEHTGYKKGWHDGIHECIKIVKDYKQENKES